MSVLSSILLIGIGATIGASLRYFLGEWLAFLLGRNFPYGTLSANIIGAFLAGILLVFVLEKASLAESYRLLLVVGLTGSLTTLSALSAESLVMIGAGNYAQALLNIGLNLGLSLLFVGAGVALARVF